MRSIKYKNSAGGPSVSSFLVNFVGSDGTLTSNTAVGTVGVVTPPVVDLNGADAGTGFTSTWSNLGAVNIADPLVGIVFDGQSTSMTTVTASISGYVPGSGDVLASTATTNISSSFNGTTGVLTLTNTGVATLTQFQTAMRSVTYNNTLGGVNAVSKTVNFQGTDGISSGAIATATINIAPLALDLNGAPLGTGYTTFWKTPGTVPIIRADGRHGRGWQNGHLDPGDRHHRHQRQRQRRPGGHHHGDIHHGQLERFQHPDPVGLGYRGPLPDRVALHHVQQPGGRPGEYGQDDQLRGHRLPDNRFPDGHVDARYRHLGGRTWSAATSSTTSPALRRRCDTTAMT